MEKGGRPATKQTTKHITKPQNPEGTKKGYKVKVIDNETGKAGWIDGSRGLAKDPKGDLMSPPGKSPLSSHPQKVPKTVKTVKE